MDPVKKFVKETYFAVTHVKKSVTKGGHVTLAKRSVLFLAHIQRVHWIVLNLVLLALNDVIGIVHTEKEDAFYLVV